MEAPPLADLSEAVRLERLRRRLKQADVAELAGITQPAVSDVENGKASADRVRAVADALGIAS
jgi:transcriptional regulator with XRE-family HTH domain